jgi:hypothetical protein
MVGVQGRTLWGSLELKALDFPDFVTIVLVFTVPHPSHSDLKNVTALPQ